MPAYHKLPAFPHSLHTNAAHPIIPSSHSPYHTEPVLLITYQTVTFRIIESNDVIDDYGVNFGGPDDLDL